MVTDAQFMRFQEEFKHGFESRLSLFPKPNKIKAFERFSDLRVAFYVAYNAKIRRSTPKNRPPSAKGNKAL